MDPVRELPYWPAAMALLIEAGQMTASDYVPTHPDLLLASEGASTDDIRSTRIECPIWVVTSINFASSRGFASKSKLSGRLD